MALENTGGVSALRCTAPSLRLSILPEPCKQIRPVGLAVNNRQLVVAASSEAVGCAGYPTRSWQARNAEPQEERCKVKQSPHLYSPLLCMSAHESFPAVRHRAGHAIPSPHNSCTFLLQLPNRCCDEPSAGGLARWALTVGLETRPSCWCLSPSYEQWDRHRRKRRSQPPELHAPISHSLPHPPPYYGGRMGAGRRTLMNYVG